MRLNAKHGAVAVAVVIVRAISWKAIDASLDDTVDGVFGVVDVLAVLVLVCVLGLVLGKRLEEQRRQGLDSRLTTKHVGVAIVLVVGRAIAWKATGASLDFIVCGGFGVLGNVLAVVSSAVSVWRNNNDEGFVLSLLSLLCFCLMVDEQQIMA